MSGECCDRLFFVSLSWNIVFFVPDAYGWLHRFHIMYDLYELIRVYLIKSSIYSILQSENIGFEPFWLSALTCDLILTTGILDSPSLIFHRQYALLLLHDGCRWKFKLWILMFSMGVFNIIDNSTLAGKG